MLETVALELDHIRTDGGTQPREYLNELVLSDYTEAMTDGVEFPSLTVFFDGSHYWLADGFHRFFAAKKHGLGALAVEIHQGTRRDAVLYAAGANATHGLRRTNADKRRVVLTLLQDEEWQGWSNREIARQCRVTHTFVSRLRKELTEGSVDTAGAPASGAPASGAPASSSASPWATAGTSEATGQTPPLSRLYDEPVGASPAIEGATRYAPLMYEQFPSTGAVIPPFVSPRDDAALPRSDGAKKRSLEELAASSHQTPADWMAEMIVSWLLDLAKQYEGVTPSIVQQAAERLGPHYDKARQQIV